MKKDFFKELVATCNLFSRQGRPVHVAVKPFAIKTTAGVDASSGPAKTPCHHIRQGLVDSLSDLVLGRGNNINHNLKAFKKNWHKSCFDK